VHNAGHNGSGSFASKLAVVTGGGSGMGRELTRQLAAARCSVAACDLNPDTVAETAALAQADAAVRGVRVTGHACDVSDEMQVLRFRDELLRQHARDHVDLVFANAGVGGGGSFVTNAREQWERTFAIDWYGVYYCARTFLPLLMASGDGVLVNTSSVAGLWATLGSGVPNTAYSTAKFAVRGFTEGLIEDLRSHAPQVRVVLVLPGHVGTDIAVNTRRVHGLPGPADLDQAHLTRAREFLGPRGLLPEGTSDDELRRLIARLEADFKDKAVVSAAQAATAILDGVRSGAWRILVGDGAGTIDAAVRAKPESAYDYAELFRETAHALCVAEVQDERASQEGARSPQGDDAETLPRGQRQGFQPDRGLGVQAGGQRIDLLQVPVDGRVGDDGRRDRGQVQPAEH
jgi:NAD(P)-dependent dehydrogenase (short-subunit alcohol dehydrogenase family)